MANTRAVIFDRDGVLADFDYRSAREYFNHLPISLNELGQRWQSWGEMCGFPSNLKEEQIFFEGFWNHLGDELQISERVLTKFRKFNYAEYLVLFPDARNILTWLKKEGIRTGILTNFTLASLEMSLKVLGIWEYIDVACGATIIGVAKPDPEAYSILMEKLKADPGRTLFFDDDIRHVAGARGAGILNAFHVNRSACCHDFKRKRVKDLTAVKDIVERLNH